MIKASDLIQSAAEKAGVRGNSPTSKSTNSFMESPYKNKYQMVSEKARRHKPSTGNSWPSSEGVYTSLSSSGAQQPMVGGDENEPNQSLRVSWRMGYLGVDFVIFRGGLEHFIY